MSEPGIRTPLQLSDRCVRASDRLVETARRLRVAQDDLHDAEVAHREANEAMDLAEAECYGKPLEAQKNHE